MFYRAIPVVDIKVDDGDSGDAISRLCILGRHSGIVDETESHRPPWLSVMT